MLIPLRPVDGTGSSGIVVVGETEIAVLEVVIGGTHGLIKSPRTEKGKARAGHELDAGSPGSFDKGKRRRKSSLSVDGGNGSQGSLTRSRAVVEKMAFSTVSA